MMLRWIISTSHVPLGSPFPELTGEHVGRGWEQQARGMHSLSLSQLNDFISSLPSSMISLFISGANFLLIVMDVVPDSPPPSPRHTEAYFYFTPKKIQSVE